MKNGKTKIVIQGPLPPPYGGVSIYTMRLGYTLKAMGFDCEVRCSNWMPDKKYPDFVRGAITKLDWIKYALSIKSSIIHLETSGLPTPYGKGIKLYKALGKKIVLTVHSFRTNLTEFNDREMQNVEKTLSIADSIIAVGPHIKEKLEKSIKKLPEVYVIPAYLKPLEFERDSATISENAKRFVHNHRPIMSTNGYVKLVEGKDLYGIDLCIEIVGQLKRFYPNIGLYIAVTEITDRSHYEKILLRINELKIFDNIYWETDKKPFLPILKQSDLYLRLTTSDGASVAIGEALTLGIPSLASNITPRYSGTLLCNRDNVKEIIMAIRKIIEGQEYVETKLDESLSTKMNMKKLIEVYDNVYTNK